ncbi:NAD(P)-dependent dehydrogenase (short-subunit alcohol dehydrogenase family) [Silvimonas terrae]|uniref:NAD(P)-dependent dehydrogenase (Short-subunit alcohol dehydrogenase family) n=1 Tax=Silvimonas terrae TaxID=300266 RepID=A0A840RB99_9NEIS|nr:SDR family oxidoreductase [Silvimonas terrae]MBB5190187.1 NAD(P)-dependent dehydrogenase (short-subunit alcohol dehydrogenase family) [Silvimonas terrae]
MASFQQQRVLVIGGSSGIGFVVAQSFVEAGASVTIASRSADKLDKAAQEIGGQVAVAALDTGDNAAVERFFADTAPWDHIVISAAQTPSGPARALALEDAYRAMDSKFWGAYRIARAARFAPGASLTFVSGFLAVRPSKNSVLQGAINAAIESLARGLALELSPVRVNTVSPGMIVTPLWDKMPEADRQQVFEKAAARLPAGRIGQPQDIANAVLYLAGTPFATGSTVLVDGGGAIA